MFENSNFQTTITAFAARHRRTTLYHITAFSFQKMEEFLSDCHNSRVANAKIVIGKSEFSDIGAACTVSPPTSQTPAPNPASPPTNHTSPASDSAAY